jgi:hypothetical protein
MEEIKTGQLNRKSVAAVHPKQSMKDVQDWKNSAH